MKIDRTELLQTISKMKSEGFDYLVKITAVDYVDHIDAIYIIRNFDSNKDETIETSLNPLDLWLHTIINLHPSADWYERELSEMFGIEIRGRNMQKLLLEKWDGTEYPLRKSFQWNSEYKTEDESK